MFVTGLGTAVPPWRYTQQECWEALQASPQFPKLATRSQALLRKVLTSDNGIRTRHLALPDLREAFDLSPDTLHQRFRDHAPRLAADAARQALDGAGGEAPAIDAVIVSTCTGYLCPGLSSYATELLELRSDVLPLDLVGQGCGAALPSLAAAEALLSSGRAGRVLVICVEVCSAAFYLDNDPGVLISACLFADGAAAAVLSREASPRHRRVEWITSGVLTVPADRDLLRFEQEGGRLRNILRPEVPSRAALCAEQVHRTTLTKAGVTPQQITGWVFHPGGRDVLRALRERFGLPEADLRWSAAVLGEFGNLSSPSVLFVLRRAMAEQAPGGWWWMSSFGAGFSCYGALLRVE
jgi:alkylresorcinol/alkylpyrone synthase